MRLVSRGDTSVVDAYLSPVLRRYVDEVAAELAGVRLLFMQSNGGLADGASFRGKDSILSGPAGGIVGMARTAAAAGFDRVIGFDMGGTSTDVSHYAGELERQYETEVAGVRMRAPMLSIHTVAAGGGSILHFDDGRYRVGPDSAGADPGPACYGRGGPLTVTDANVLLGRVQPDHFPRVFGASGDRPLDVGETRRRFAALAARDHRRHRRPARPRAGRGRLPRDRGGEHGERDQEDLGPARLRRDQVRAVHLRRRGRPARLRGGRRPRHDQRAHPPAGGRAVRLRHRPGRRDRDARVRRRGAADGRVGGPAARRGVPPAGGVGPVRPGRPGRGAARHRGDPPRPPPLRRHRHPARGSRTAPRRR